MSTLESEMESGMSNVKSQISKLESLIKKFVGNGGNGSQLLGRNNETSDKIDDAVVYKKHFFVIKEDKSWKEARRSCQASGGDLVTLNSNAEQQRLVEFLKKTMPEEGPVFWIYSKKYKDGWTKRDSTSCFVIKPFRNPVTVGTQLCKNKIKPAVCEKFVENGGDGSQQLGGNNETSNNIDHAVGDDKKNSTDGADRFFVIKGVYSGWESARSKCQDLGLNLVTLNSNAEKKHLAEFLKKTIPYYAYETRTDSGQFWINRNCSFMSAYEGEPTCGMIHPRGGTRADPGYTGCKSCNRHLFRGVCAKN